MAMGDCVILAIVGVATSCVWMRCLRTRVALLIMTSVFFEFYEWGKDGIVGVLAVTCFDHSYKRSEALLCRFRDKAGAAGDATDGIGDDGIIRIICIVLEFETSGKARKDMEEMTHDEFSKNSGVGVNGYDIEEKLDLVLFHLWELVRSHEKPGVVRCEEALQGIGEWG